jgi:uncharacterized membrane protein YphA (DoxX/SURF4 family)
MQVYNFGESTNLWSLDMPFQIEYEVKDYVRIILLCFLGGLFLMRGSSTLLSLQSENIPFDRGLDTAINYLGSIAEILVGCVIVLLGFFPDDVEELLENIL